jgi:hypothetical protein
MLNGSEDLKAKEQDNENQDEHKSRTQSSTASAFEDTVIILKQVSVRQFLWKLGVSSISANIHRRSNAMKTKTNVKAGLNPQPLPPLKRQ